MFFRYISECLVISRPSGLHSHITSVSPSLHTLLKIMHLNSSSPHCFSPNHYLATIPRGICATSEQASGPLIQSIPLSDTMRARSNILHEELETTKVRDQEKIFLCYVGQEEAFLLGKVMGPNPNSNIWYVNKISPGSQMVPSVSAFPTQGCLQVPGPHSSLKSKYLGS